MALVLGIRYIFERCVATDVDDYERVEWPPHPARVYMALVAAHFEDPPANASDRQAEAQALRWLEELSPPEVIAPTAMTRTVVEQYVPINDECGLTTGKKPAQPLQSIPLGRIRQPRTFPSAYLECDTVFLEWTDVRGFETHRPALERLCRRVTRIGHSSSLVQLWVADELPQGLPRWVPAADGGGTPMRIPTAGLLDELSRLYERQIRPVIGTWQAYRRADANGHIPPGSVWDDELIVLRITPERGRTHHRWLSLLGTLGLTRRFRDALIAQADAAGATPLPEWISGHKPDGSPSERPHLAVFPLAFVGREHADGHVLGLGLAVPVDVPTSQRRKLLRLVRRVRELKLGRQGVWGLQELTWETPPWNLQSRAWTGGEQGARLWGSVTPVVPDRHPKSRERAEAERQLAEQVADGCERINLPRPVEVRVVPVSAHLGAPASHEFPRLRRKDGSERQHRHVVLRFAEPVRGPVAIGAGRYRGYGFCRPLREKEA